MKIALPLVGALLNGVDTYAQNTPQQAICCPCDPYPIWTVIGSFAAGFALCLVLIRYLDWQNDRKLDDIMDKWDGVS